MFISFIVCLQSICLYNWNYRLCDWW